MPRRNTQIKIRAQYAGELRQAERDRRRKRIAAAKTHPRRTTYRELSA